MPTAIDLAFVHPASLYFFYVQKSTDVTCDPLRCGRSALVEHLAPAELVSQFQRQGSEFCDFSEHLVFCEKYLVLGFLNCNN